MGQVQASKILHHLVWNDPASSNPARGKFLSNLEMGQVQASKILHHLVWNDPASSNPARDVSDICDGEDLCRWSQLEIKLNAFRC